MRKSKFSESQVLNLLKQAESGVPVVDICRENGISNATFYKWRAKYGGMDASMMKRLKELEQENGRLKRMFADSQMDNEILKETLKKL
jgi:putative transposase